MKTLLRSRPVLSVLPALLAGLFLAGVPGAAWAASDGGGDERTPLFVDTDFDGILDWWEVFWFGNLSQPADGDPDADGLTNIREYHYHTDLNPGKPGTDGADTDGDLLPDGWEIEFGLDPLDGDAFGPNGSFGDPDGDGVLNFSECHGADAGRVNDIDGSGDETDPLNGDTDDDGLSDRAEIDAVPATSAVDSMDPLVRRGAAVLGAGGIPIPDPAAVVASNLLPVVNAMYYRPDLVARDWTIECFVRPGAADLRGDLLAYRLPVPPSLDERYGYRLSLSNNVPSVGFHAVTDDGFHQVSGAVLATGEWAHVAGVWDHAADTLSLYVNGIPNVQTVAWDSVSYYAELFGLYATNPPAVAVSDGSFAGGLCIDELRFWNRPLSTNELAVNRYRLIDPDSSGLAAYYRFDDGGSSAEDFTRGRANTLTGAAADRYPFGNHAYGLGTNAFAFRPDCHAPVWEPAEFGSLQVYLESATNTPLPATAEWRVDGGDWQLSGNVVTGLSPTNHDVSFGPVPGWIPPSNLTAAIPAGGTLVVTSLYAEAAGSVTGTVYSASVWSNVPPAALPPGDGTGGGRMIVGAWSPGASETNAPLSVDIVGQTNALPFNGETNAFTVWSPGSGPLSVMAWIDGNGDGRYEFGEPRSPRVQVNVTADPADAGELVIGDDSDGDGIADWWEVHWFGNLDEDRNADPDRDGLTTGQELDLAADDPALVGLNPANWDSDGDLVDDGWEVANYADGAGLSPVVPDAGGDADGDGLSNAQEYHGVDGAPEREQDPEEDPGIARLHPDDSGDDLDPLDLDTDGDALVDSFEAAWYDPAGGIDPRSPASALSDADTDGLTAYREQCLLPALAGGGTNDIWTTGSAGLPAVDPVTGIRAFEPKLLFGATNSPAVTGDLASVRGAFWTDPSVGTGYDEELPAGWDTDDDDLPDGWEVEFNLDPRRPDGAEGFAGDPDGDGLWNGQEYLGQDGERAAARPRVDGSGDETSPRAHDDVGTARPEISLGLDAGIDTDDDGLTDSAEIQAGFTSPVHAMHPFVKRSALLRSAAGMAVPDPWGGTNGFRPDLLSRDWTIECYVKTMDAGCTGYLVSNADTETNGVSYRLALSNNVPSVSFDTVGGTTYRVSALAIPANRWVYLAGTWDHAANALTLYVDGVAVVQRAVFEESVSFDHVTRGSGSGRPPTLGESPDGSFTNRLLLDEVRIWSLVRTPGQIEDARRWLIDPAEPGLSAYFRFDDGGAWAEDFTRRALSSLDAASPAQYFWADHGYGPQTNGAAAWRTDAAQVLGVHAFGADDGDGDGLPNGWELVNHLDPTSAAGDNGGDGDPDGDGLSNLYEYWAGTNPRGETDENGVFDVFADPDGDLLANIQEQVAGSRPDVADTDDDAAGDGLEWFAGSDPVDVLEPGVTRALALAGTYGDYLSVPVSFEQRLPAWTLEAWVNPAAADAEAFLIRRTVQELADGQAMNYVLGLRPLADGWQPFAGYVTPAGQTNYLYGPQFATGTWTHVAASYDPATYTLALYTNGAESVTAAALQPLPPVNGKGGETYLRIGEGLDGRIDEARVWGLVRTAGEIANNYVGYVPDDAEGLVHDFRFDDGGATAQDFRFRLDWEQQWIHAAERVGNALFTDAGGGAIAPPSVQVFIEPEDAVDAGAAWRLSDGDEWSDWMISGVTVAWIDDGDYTIEYTNLFGWTAPPDEAFTISENGLLQFTGVYARVTGIFGYIQPDDAVATGAQWRVDSGPWTNSGAFLPVTPGAHTVQFSSLTNWLVPAAQVVDVTNGYHVAVTGIYYLVEIDGGYGIELGEFNHPRGLVFDSLGMLYVADSDNHRIQMLDPLTDAWTGWGTLGTNTGEFFQPFGLAVDASDNLYVADANNNRVQMRNATTGVWTAWGGILEGTGQGEFNGPFDVAVDSAGVLYVADHYNHRVQKRAPDGTWSTFINNGFDEGDVRNPRGLAVDGAGNLYVTDYDPTTGTRVQEFDSAGNFVQRIGGPDPAEGGLARSRGLDLRGTYPLYVADTDNNRVVVVTAPLELATFADGILFDAPEDTAVDAKQNVIIADTGNHRIVTIWIDPLAPYTASGPVRTAEGHVTISWYGAVGWVYVLEYTDDLRNPDWQPVPGCPRQPGNNAVLGATDLTAAGVSVRFYRVAAY